MRVRGHRFFFYSNEGSEPPHVHGERAEFTAKFWLPPVESAAKTRFDDRELRLLRRLIEHRRDLIEEAWHEHFGG
ncbi:DUF4160 domain-containing protein [Microbacterium maritypicum]|uniref:DUF4160 domain-containing protein n=1 Tax=Microbacterium maritypicum TaxID=33918 RepID=A0AAD3ZYB0_MICMQ|nr:DUF4160 domain-containing protein [Microbacterium liquefaciens]KAB1884023.1 DUF4160 domain-containing protein [Microbacterium liquefaciens]